MTHNQPRTDWKKEFTFSLLTGILYGSTATIVGHPFDTIKTKMQAQSEHMKSGSFTQCLTKVWRRDGIVGLYRGWIPPLWGSAIYRSLQFAVFEAFYTKWQHNPQMTQKIPHTLGLEPRVIVAGLISGTSRAIVECPIEYAKVKRQTKQKWKLRDGYKGFHVQWCRTVGLMTSYFMMLDTLRRNTDLLKSKKGQFFASGFCATLCFWFVWPFEIMKNQIQAETQEMQGRSMRDRAKFMFQQHGIKGLFRGIVPGTLSIFLRNGASMVVMQYAQRKLTEWKLR